MLGLGDRPVIGTFGFLLPHKGTLELVEAVDSLRTEFPDISCSPCAPGTRIGVLTRTRSDPSGDRDQGTRRQRHADNRLPPRRDEPGSCCGASTSIVLPYHDTGESSSAALRFILPLERAVVVTDQPIFADARHVVEVAEAGNPRGIEQAIARVLGNDGLRANLGGRRTPVVQSVPLGPGGRRPPGRSTWPPPGPARHGGPGSPRSPSPLMRIGSVHLTGEQQAVFQPVDSDPRQGSWDVPGGSHSKAKIRGYGPRRGVELVANVSMLAGIVRRGWC